ncbi:MAG: S8 family serine peptidase [Dehalococcoidia bacterium]
MMTLVVIMVLLLRSHAGGLVLSVRPLPALTGPAPNSAPQRAAAPDERMPQAATAPLDFSSLDPATVDAGHVLVQLRGADAGVLLTDFAAAFAAAPAQVVTVGGDPSTLSLTLPQDVPPAAALAWLSARPDITYAEPDYVLQALATPNDPLFATDQQYLSDIHAPEAWDVQTGDPSVVVAVLDSGIDLTHPDLAANIWTNPNAGLGDCGQDVHGCNFVPSTSNTLCPPGPPIHSPDVTPLTWHGTFVAGVIGARGNNGQGIAGVAWDVSLMPVRVTNCRNTADTTGFVNALHYAVDQGARIIDVSSGSGRSAGAGCRLPSRFMADAVQYARDHGVLVVAGVGNQDKGCVSDPAAAPGALAVAGFKLPGPERWSTSRTGPGSNWGPEVAVAAPAVGIVSTVLFDPLAKPPNDRYGAASGTSFAAPIVAGEAALLLSQNALLTPDWLITLIELGAQPQPDGLTPNWAGAGSVDIAASLRLAPAGYSGAVREAGQPAPDGALVEAYVGDQQCAQSAAYADGDHTSYALLVPAAAMQPGCGVAGTTVDIRVDGVPALSVPWTQSAMALDLDVAAPTEALHRSAAPSWPRATDSGATGVVAATMPNRRRGWRRRRRRACV